MFIIQSCELFRVFGSLLSSAALPFHVALWFPLESRQGKRQELTFRLIILLLMSSSTTGQGFPAPRGQGGSLFLLIFAFLPTSILHRCLGRAQWLLWIRLKWKFYCDLQESHGDRAPVLFVRRGFWDPSRYSGSACGVGVSESSFHLGGGLVICMVPPTGWWPGILCPSPQTWDSLRSL